MDARTRKGDKLLKEGRQKEAAQDYDGALTLYEQALDEDAHEPAYLIATQRCRNKASEQHVTQGRKLLELQKLEAALVQFQKALMTDPSSQVALQLIMQTNEMLKEKSKAPEGTVILTPAERARRDVVQRINTLEGPPVLRPINNQISNLKMNNQTSRVIYESIGKLAGINVLFDPAGIDTLGSTTRNFNLDLNNATLEEALQYVALVTHTFWKPISRNAIFVTQESEPKRQEYQDEVVKVFYIQNASTANEFTEIFNGVRIGAKLTTGIFQVASQNAIIARGTADTMALVEKLIHDLDRPKAEVLIDIIVVEVNKSVVTNLGAALQGSNILSVAPGAPATTSTTGTTTTTTSSGNITLSQLPRLSSNQFSVTLPGAVAQALLTDSRSHLLNHPQVRVTDGGKGTLKIGQKIPYVSGSLNSAVATPGSVPYATTQFQQIDVGVNVDVQPHVNGPDDVSMHIKVEISSVVNTDTIAGVAEPVIGQQVNEADVRMRDGEYTLLGGLSQDSTSLSVSGLPGVSNIPVLGYLFGTKMKNIAKDDILIALVPHIIRAQAVDDQLAEGVLAGTERMVRVERRQQPEAAAPPAPVILAPTPARPGTQVTPQLPPPGGQANMLPPTNNPRMATSGGAIGGGVLNGGVAATSSLVQPVPQPAASQPVPRSVPLQQAVSQPSAAPVPVPMQPPGTEVTPLQGMQQMGLTPDPLPTATPESGDSSSNASTGVTVGPELRQQQEAVAESRSDPSAAAPVLVIRDGAEQNRTAPEPVAAPTTTNPDNASYAVIGPDAKPTAKTAKAASAASSATAKPQAVIDKTKPANVVKVQLASGTSAATSTPAKATTTTQQPAAAGAAPAAASKQSAPVQLLEGHLTQEPDSSTTTAPPKQK